MTLKNVAATLLLTAALLSGCTDKLAKYERAQRQTVLIQTDGSFGSGVMFRRVNRDGDFRWFCLTARHVIEDDADGEVIVKVIRRYAGQITSETTYHAIVIAKENEPRPDIALLWVTAEPDAFRPSELADRDPVPVGTEIFAVGNFRGPNFPNSVSTGIISQHGVKPAMQGWPSDWAVVDQTTVPCFPGSSGGGFFDSRGQVIGICVGGIDAVLNVIVPVRAIEDWALENQVYWALQDGYCPADKTLVAMSLNHE